MSCVPDSASSNMGLERAIRPWTSSGGTAERRLSLCDAISFIVVTTLLDRMPCFAFDEDFRRLGLTGVPPPH